MRVPGGLSAIRRTFALRDYRLFVVGNLSSNIGLWLQRVAAGWLTWELTHSTAWLGGIAVAESAPTLILSLIAGTVVDRVDYFKMLRITQACSTTYAVAAAALTLTGMMNIWVLLALTLFRGAVASFNRPSRMTVVFTLVGRDLLASALAVNSIIFNCSRFVGPAIGGAIIVAGGVGWAFTASAALFLVFTLVLGLMRVEPVMQERQHRSMMTESVAGLRYILSHPGIRLQLVLLVGTSLFAKPITDLLPGFAGQIFHSGADGLAWLLSAHGIGAMAGASLLAGRGKGISGMTRLTIGSILFMGVALLLFVATPVFWLALPLIGLVGFGFIMQNVTNQTLIQSATDPAFRGRVLSIYGMVSQGVPSLGTLTIGGLAEHLGLRLPVAIGAVLCVLLWAWAWQRRKPLASVLEVEPPAVA